jgi:hypothetical protein
MKTANEFEEVIPTSSKHQACPTEDFLSSKRTPNTNN